MARPSPEILEYLDSLRRFTPELVRKLRDDRISRVKDIVNIKRSAGRALAGDPPTLKMANQLRWGDTKAPDYEMALSEMSRAFGAMPMGQATDLRNSLIDAFFGETPRVKEYLEGSGMLEEQIRKLLAADRMIPGKPAVRTLEQNKALKDRLMENSRWEREKATRGVPERAFPDDPREAIPPEWESLMGRSEREMADNALEGWSGAPYNAYEGVSIGDGGLEMPTNFFFKRGTGPQVSEDMPSYIPMEERLKWMPGERVGGEYASMQDQLMDTEGLEKFFGQWPPPSSANLTGLTDIQKVLGDEVVRVSPRDPGWKARKLSARVSEDSAGYRPSEEPEQVSELAQAILASLSRDREGGRILNRVSNEGMRSKLVRSLQQAQTPAEVATALRKAKVGGADYKLAMAVAKSPSKSLEVSRATARALTPSAESAPARGPTMARSRDRIAQMTGATDPETMGRAQQARGLVQQIDVLDKEGQLAVSRGDKELAAQLRDLVRTMREELAQILSGR